MKKIFFLVITVISISACTKVIDVNLNSVTPQYVIDAPLLAGKNDFVVRISKTGDYFGTDKPTPVINAVISFKKSGDSAVVIKHESEGNYRLSNYTAVINTEYFLSVVIDGKTFQASSFLPKAVPLDSLKRTRVPTINRDPKFPADSFQINCYFNDPAAETNFYRIKTVKNGIIQGKGEDLLVVEDRLSNGIKVILPIYTALYKLSDSVEVELVSMDRKMYDYFNTLSTLVDGGNNSAAPTNPLSNFSGGCLGYFGAFSSSKKTVIVK
jgi:Domain of unknown function (DUF4249)